MAIAPPVAPPLLKPEDISKFFPIARGTVRATGRGWFRANYYNPTTGAKKTFTEPPTVVAMVELRSGRIPSVSAPTISIPRITLPSAPTIAIPSMAIPSIRDIPRVIKTQSQLIDAIYARLPSWIERAPAPLWGNWRNAFAQGLGRILNLFQEIVVTPQVDRVRNAINTGLRTVRSNTQTALNRYRDAIQSSMNKGLSDTRDKTQAALNAYRDGIQRSVNSGLSAIIPTMYSMMGLGTNQLVSPVSTRNVRTDGFEFYALSRGMILHYVAVGKVTIPALPKP